MSSLRYGHQRVGMYASKGTLANQQIHATRIPVLKRKRFTLWWSMKFKAPLYLNVI